MVTSSASPRQNCPATSSVILVLARRAGEAGDTASWLRRFWACMALCDCEGAGAPQKGVMAPGSPPVDAMGLGICHAWELDRALKGVGVAIHPLGDIKTARAPPQFAAPTQWRRT